MTECWKNSVLRLLPGVWLLVGIIIGFPFLHKKRPPHITSVPFSKLQITKLVLAGCFAAFGIVDLAYVAINFNNYPNAAIIIIMAPIIEIVIMV